MALSLLSQQQQQSYSSILDYQTFVDPITLQQRCKNFDFSNSENSFQMEYSNQSHYHHHNSTSSSGMNNNNNSHHTQSPNINQALSNTNRNFINGYHQHFGTDYEQVINFVDSPPNSEDSWTDEPSKGSPLPQIIDVQTIYVNSGSRKRRMDWDSLDISQSGNTTTTQPGELANKVPHQEKDKQKREKLSGRGSWSDDIGFDLSSEFNTNSYLNNDNFLTFSPALTTLKQEPQADQLKLNKNPLNLHPTPTGAAVSKSDKLSPLGDSIQNLNEKSQNGLTDSLCESPQNSQQGFEANPAVEEANNAATFHVDESQSRSGAGIQQLAVVDATKIENSPSVISSHSEDHKFQYILAAATSIATKNNEETLTYLNQGQSYEIKLKKIGDLSFYRDKILKSVIKICFHERRLQFMEREQMQQWQASRPGERIVEVDVPLSYGLCHVSQPLNPNYLNTVEVFWDPLKEVGVYIKVNCISTEFTPKKHGGEKGVPFRLQIETYIENTNTSVAGGGAAAAIAASQSPLVAAAASPSNPGNLTPNSSNASSLVGSKQPVHVAACQIKVFKLKGADRKHKQDREKIQKRPQSEQEKFQPSYECTIMNDIPLDLITPSSGCYSPEYLKIWNSPVHISKHDGISPYPGVSPATNSSPIAINSVTSSNSPTLKILDANMLSPQQGNLEIDDYQTIMNIMPESTPAQVAQWLTYHRLTSYVSTFAHFSGSDIMRMSKEDLIQICGLADGIRMFNILRAKAIAPRSTIYVSLDGSNYNAIYLISSTSKELTQKLLKLSGIYEMIASNSGSGGGALENGTLYNSWGSMHSKYSGSGSNIFNEVSKAAIYICGPGGVHVTITDEVLNNEIKDGSLYTLEAQNGKVLMKLINKNDH